jgi:hypothetical protein
LQQTLFPWLCKNRIKDVSVVFDVTDVVEIFSGSLNTMQIEDSGESSTIEVMVDSKLVELERASNRRYTRESQRSRYPDDKFFNYVAKLQDSEIVWGRKN